MPDHQTTDDASASNGHPAAADVAAFDWCIVEIFGHRRHAGRGREEEKFGCKMLRIDVPLVEYVPDQNTATATIDGAIKRGSTGKIVGWKSHFYGGSSIFSFTPTDEETVVRMNLPMPGASLYRLSAPEPEADEFDFEDEVPGTVPAHG